MTRYDFLGIPIPEEEEAMINALEKLPPKGLETHQELIRIMREKGASAIGSAYKRRLLDDIEHPPVEDRNKLGFSYQRELEAAENASNSPSQARKEFVDRFGPVLDNRRSGGR